MRYAVLLFALVVTFGCEDKNPVGPSNSKTTLTSSNIQGMWYLSSDNYKGQNKVDGIVTGTYDETEQYAIDSTEVILFGQTSCKRYYPDYYDNCYSVETYSYSILNGKINGAMTEDEYDLYDTANGYYENWLFQDSYIQNGELIILFKEVGLNEEGQYEGIYTAIYKKYTLNLPHPNWPYSICSNTLSKRQIPKSKRAYAR